MNGWLFLLSIAPSYFVAIRSYRLGLWVFNAVNGYINDMSQELIGRLAGFAAYLASKYCNREGCRVGCCISNELF
jgi:hypothetical protein